MNETAMSSVSDKFEDAKAETQLPTQLTPGKRQFGALSSFLLRYRYEVYAKRMVNNTMYALVRPLRSSDVRCELIVS